MRHYVGMTQLTLDIPMRQAQSVRDDLEAAKGLRALADDLLSELNSDRPPPTIGDTPRAAKLALLDRLRPSDFAKLYETASRLERRALGMPDRVQHEVTGPNGGPIQVESTAKIEIEHMTPEQRAAYRALLEASQKP